MEAHGFTVQVSKGDIKIKRTRSRLFMRALRFEERVELGRWVGRAYEALRSDNSENCVLYISEQARYGDNTRSISW